MPRQPSARALFNRVDLARLVRTGQDADATLAAAYTPIAAAVPCSVQLQSSETEKDPETGRVTRFNHYLIVFVADYGLLPRDRITWVDQGVTRHLYVSGRIDGAGRGVVFEYTATEVV